MERCSAKRESEREGEGEKEIIKARRGRWEKCNNIVDATA